MSQDVLEKAELIAQEWGLKNARAAVEAVFRKYADEYLSRDAGRNPGRLLVDAGAIATLSDPLPKPQPKSQPATCDALNELDELLGL
ncbi:MAG: hypothetical protein NW220_14965 [Leptolyngbyaceae cyanobacterium bins.349]|nr:hypothetical protein [Leptolyngbyaceae cyanobacterium bins.349]